MGSSSSASPPPPPMIGRAGNLTVFITPPSPASTPRGASRTPPPESQRSDFSTPTPQRAAPSPSPSPSPRNHESPVAAPAGVLTPPPPPAPAKVAPPPVQVPPPQYEKASVGGKHDGSAFGFFWDAVARVQEDFCPEIWGVLMLGFSLCSRRSAREPRRVRGYLVRVGSVQVPVGAQRLLRGHRQGSGLCKRW
ncbi:early nodulin-20-like isoform X1 [Miscanthus floridulus]|uniref:early nodulin-20-like isoform X1 n=1 Tax=Miscanthus floridulus TaxID=154761 RepID=UPI003459D411